MNVRQIAADDRQAEIELDNDNVVHYEDGDATVMCDRMNPSAWIRIGQTSPIER